MFKSKGYLIYYPSWWIVLRCCDDLASYYRSLIFNKEYLAPPPFKSHITVVNGGVETPPNVSLWGKREGKEIEFEYTNEIDSAYGYYWVPVKCEALLDLREELGLSRRLQWPLHLTVAKEKWSGP